MLRVTFTLSLAIVGSLSLCAVSPAAEQVDFAHQIVPILRKHCGSCHTGDAKKGGFSLNTRAELLAGGESGPAVVIGKSGGSELIARVTSSDADLKMPPDGPRVPADQVPLLKRWIDSGLTWDEGFSFRPPSYEPPLKPRHVELPAVTSGRTNPVDRILDAYLAARKRPQTKPIDDATFARRAYLDLVGLLPTPNDLQAFLSDTAADKRSRLIDRLRQEQDATFADSIAAVA